MFFKTLVECLLERKKNPNDAMALNALHSLTRQMKNDLLEAYSLSLPLVLDHRNLFWESNSFMDFLIKLVELPTCAAYFEETSGKAASDERAARGDENDGVNWTPEQRDVPERKKITFDSVSFSDDASTVSTDSWEERYDSFVEDVLPLFPNAKSPEGRKKVFEELRDLRDRITEYADLKDDGDWLSATAEWIRHTKQNVDRVKSVMNAIVRLAPDIPSEFKTEWKDAFVERYRLLTSAFRTCAGRLLGADEEDVSVLADRVASQISREKTEGPNWFYEYVVERLKGDRPQTRKRRGDDRE